MQTVIINKELIIINCELTQRKRHVILIIRRLK